MKCIVCSETIKSGQSRCSFCGFPVIAGTAGTDAERQAISEVGAAYYWAQMKKISIDLVTYQYQYEDGHLKPAGKNELRIFDGAVISGETENVMAHKAETVIHHEDKTVIPHEAEKMVDNITEKKADPGIDEVEADAQAQIIWYPQKICQLQGGRTYELCPKVTYKDRIHVHRVRIKAPEMDGYTYTGLMLGKGFEAKLVIGDAQNYSCSEEFCLIQ